MNVCVIYYFFFIMENWWLSESIVFVFILLSNSCIVFSCGNMWVKIFRVILVWFWSSVVIVFCEFLFLLLVSFFNNVVMFMKLKMVSG